MNAALFRQDGVSYQERPDRRSTIHSLQSLVGKTASRLLLGMATSMMAAFRKRADELSTSSNRTFSLPASYKLGGIPPSGL